MISMFTCIDCGSVHGTCRPAQRKLCVMCSRKRSATRRRVNGQTRAYTALHTAIRRGDIAKLDGSITCIDCGAVAKHYDHRDYGRPLDVQPVCHRCNLRRGAAIPARTAA